MIIIMINYSLHCRSMHWPARIKKINILVKKILQFQKDLYFVNSINYKCNLVFVDNKFIKKINMKYRKKDKITDVLTFVSEVNIQKQKEKCCDIFFSAEMISKDSKKNGVNFYDHLTLLIVHSFLHINGFMHKTIKDFNEMKKIEIKVLDKLEISNPYL